MLAWEVTPSQRSAIVFRETVEWRHASPPRDATVHSGVGKRHPMRPHPCCGGQARRAQVPSLINSTVYLLRGDTCIFLLVPTVPLLNLVSPLFYKKFHEFISDQCSLPSHLVQGYLDEGEQRAWEKGYASSSGTCLKLSALTLNIFVRNFHRFLENFV
jgi:hypothetical protein